uniref:Periphilin-1 C-terminal domain-containing protein n=1 Tax=Strigamia maritima TaxID=126957 RepID=T1ILG4_STRMM
MWYANCELYMSDRLKKRSWKHDTSQKNEQYGPEVAEKEKSEEGPAKDPTSVDEVEAKQDENWQAKKTDAPEIQGPRSPASSQDRAASRSDSHSRSTSASSHSHGKERKKKKKKHHRSKHRRHRRRHRHQRDSSDEEGQLSDYEEGERSPTPDHHRRYRKRRRQSSSSSQDSQTNKNKRGESDKGSTMQSNTNNLGLNMPISESNQKQQDSLAATNAPVESDGHLTLRSLEAPSQVSDGMSPLHVSEGDEEETPTYNFRVSGVDRYGVLPSATNQLASDMNDTQLSKFSMQEELDNEDRLLTATRDALLREVHELTTSATSGTVSKNIARTKIPPGVKSTLDKFKSTLKPASTQVAEVETPKPSMTKPSTTAVNLPHLTRSDGESRSMDLVSHSASHGASSHGASHSTPQVKSPSAHYAIRTTPSESHVQANDYYDPEETNLMDDSADISHEGASGDGPCMDKDFKSTVKGARRAIRTGGLNPESTAVSLPKDKISLIKRKRAEIEAAYRQDCETFATVVKMLIRKDSKLEEYIQDSLRQNLYEIGQLCIEELKQFVEVVVSTDKL